MSERYECTCERFGECHVHGFGGIASPQATRPERICGNCGLPLVQGETEEMCRELDKVAARLEARRAAQPAAGTTPQGMALSVGCICGLGNPSPPHTQHETGCPCRPRKAATPQAERPKVGGVYTGLHGDCTVDPSGLHECGVDEDHKVCVCASCGATWPNPEARAVAPVETPTQEADFKQRTIDCTKELRGHYNSDWDSTVPGAEFDAEIIRILHRYFDRIPSKAPVETRLTAEQFVLDWWKQNNREAIQYTSLVEMCEAFRDKSEAALRKEIKFADKARLHYVTENAELREEIERLKGEPEKLK